MLQANNISEREWRSIEPLSITIIYSYISLGTLNDNKYSLICYFAYSKRLYRYHVINNLNFMSIAEEERQINEYLSNSKAKLKDVEEKLELLDN